MSGHTPGPWFVGPEGTVWRRPHTDLYRYGGTVAGDQPIAVANIGWLPPDAGFPVGANARLISAAPDLLEALKASVELNKWAMECFGFDADISPQEAAIAKATGAAP